MEVSFVHFYIDYFFFYLAVLCLPYCHYLLPCLIWKREAATIIFIMKMKIFFHPLLIYFFCIHTAISLHFLLALSHLDFLFSSFDQSMALFLSFPDDLFPPSSRVLCCAEYQQMTS